MGLIFHVEFNAIHAKGYLVATSFFDGNATGDDKAFIFCADLPPSRTHALEAENMRGKLPPNCTVNNLQPTHDENPTCFQHIIDSGEDIGTEGAWTCMLMAPSLSLLAETFEVFAYHYMGLGQPLRDNSFSHMQATHCFITRQNVVNEKSWESRYTITLQIKGVVSPDANKFVAKMRHKYALMQWSERFTCDPLKILGLDRPSKCKSEAEVQSEWDKFVKWKLRLAGVQVESSVQPTGTYNSPSGFVQTPCSRAETDAIVPSTPPGVVPTTPPRTVRQFESVEMGAFSPAKFPSPARAAGPYGPLTAYPDGLDQKQSLPGNNQWPRVLPVNGYTPAEITINGGTHNIAATKLDVDGDDEVNTLKQFCITLGNYDQEAEEPPSNKAKITFEKDVNDDEALLTSEDEVLIHRMKSLLALVKKAL